MQVGDKVTVKTPWVDAEWQVSQGEITEIAYEKNSEVGKLFYVYFDEESKGAWFHRTALKVEWSNL